MITYGGYPLRPATPELAVWINSHIPPQKAFSFYKFPKLSNAIFDPRTHLDRVLSAPLMVNTLCNPWGASRWGYAVYLIDDLTLDRVRDLAYAESGYVPLPLVITDGTSSVTTDMYMLPPIPLTLAPLSADDPVNRAYLIVLVDVRYFWWEIASDLTVTENTTTWATLFTDIGTALGVTITHDAIPAAYLKPGTGLAAKHEYLPMVLDLASTSVGTRLVRTLDGEFNLISPSTAIASMVADSALLHPIAGGAMSLGVVDA